MANAEKIHVEVAYALPHKQVILDLAVEPDATLEQVIRASGMLEQFPEINLGQLSMIIRARFLVDAVGINVVRGRPFGVDELCDLVIEVMDE